MDNFQPGAGPGWGESTDFCNAQASSTSTADVRPNAVDYTRYPDVEVRTPREKFTGKLRKVLAGLDAKNAQAFVHKHFFIRGSQSSTIRVANVWVVGSYARGALTCGDLDLVAQVEIVEGTWPETGAVNKAFFGSHANVRVYHGTPQQNSSCADFSEAVHIWGPGLDWAGALDAIEPDPEAKRFARAGDVIPLRVEQHRLRADTAEGLPARLAAGELQWRFIGLSELAVPYVAHNENEQQCYDRFCELSESKRKLAPAVFDLAHKLRTELALGADIQRSDVGALQVGAVTIFVEQLELRPTALDKLATSAVAFVPRLSVRGPNGAWVIERGPQHPLVKAFEGLSAWVLASEEGRPGLCSYHCEGATADVLELFSTREGAQELEDLIADEGSDPYVPRLVAGREILEMLAGADSICYDNDVMLALTPRGMAYCVADDWEPRASNWQEAAAWLRAEMATMP